MTDQVSTLREIASDPSLRLCGFGSYRVENYRENGKTKGGKVRCSFDLVSTVDEPGQPKGTRIAKTGYASSSRWTFRA